MNQLSLKRDNLKVLEPYVVEAATIMFWLFLAASTIIFVIYILLAVAFPFPLDYGEAPLVDQAMRLAAGQNIYRLDISEPPYTIANYPPLYVLTLVPFVNLGPTFLAGRLITILSALATAVFLGQIVYTLHKNRAVAVATSLIFLAMPYVLHWSGLLRVDMLALACSTAALFLLVRWPAERWSLVAAGLLLVAAIYSRQSYGLAAPLAALVWLWTQQGWRRALTLALIVGGLALALFVILNLLTGGGFFFHIITANANEFGWERLGRHLNELGQAIPLMLILGGLYLIFGRRQPGWPLIAPYLIGAALSALTIGKVGSNVNYLLELSAALSLVVGSLLVWSRPYSWRYAALLVLLALQIGLLLETSMNLAVDFWLTPRRAATSALRSLQESLQEIEGPILADEFMGLLTMADRPLYLQPFEFTQLARAGLWDQTPLVNEIEEQAFPLILIHHFPFSTVQNERWMEEMRAAIGQHYRPMLMQAGTAQYRPYEGPAVTAVPNPINAASFNPANLQVESPQAISEPRYVSQPNITINPTNPDHLAAMVMSSSLFDCNSPNCRVDLLLYTSTDGGVTWEEQKPFSTAQQANEAGMVAFAPDGTLYAVAVRDGAITLNHAQADTGYEMGRANQVEVTRGQFAARPWLQLHPETGEVLLSYDAQVQNSFAAPGFIQSADAGQTWSTTRRAGQSVALADLQAFQASPFADVQVLTGEGDKLALVWAWSPAAWSWPMGVWIALSEDGGQTFAMPTEIAETWGPVATAVHHNNYYLLYRTGTESEQALALAISQDGGLTWSASLVNGDIPLSFDVDKAPGLGVAPDGTIDVVFYAHEGETAGCAPTLAEWQESLGTGQVDTCQYNVYYTFSEDGGQTFSQPHQLNEAPIQGERFARFGGSSFAGTHLGMASTAEFAYPVWIATAGAEGTQAYTARIER
jgi:hypothetical protein